jgi:hypothetical protein
MDLIKALWRGDLSLAKTFWLFGCCVNLLLNLAFGYLIVFNPEVILTPPGFVTFWVLFGVQLVYFPFIYVSIWRSANKYQGPQVWAILAKFMVIVGWGHYFMQVLSFFVDKTT